MDTKECYRLTQPQSKISGYATGHRHLVLQAAKALCAVPAWFWYAAFPYRCSSTIAAPFPSPFVATIYKSTYFMWCSLEWEQRPTTTRPGSGAGLAVVARADWLQRHAAESAKMRQGEWERARWAWSVEMQEKREIWTVGCIIIDA